MALQPTASGIVEYVAAVVTDELQPLIDGAGTALADIDAAKVAAVGDVTAEGATQITALQDEGAIQITAVNDAGAIQTANAAAQAAIAGVVTTETTRAVVGPTTASAGAASTSTSTFIPSVFFPYDGYLDLASLYSDAGGAGDVQFKVVRRNVGTPANFDLITELTPKVLVTGENANLDMGSVLVSKGDYLAVRRNTTTSASVGFTASAGFLYTFSGDLTATNRAVAQASNLLALNASIRRRWTADELADENERRLQASGVNLFDTVTVESGAPNNRIGATTTTTTNSASYFPVEPLSGSGPLASFSFPVGTAGRFLMTLLEPVTATTYRIAHRFFVTAASTGEDVTFTAGTDFPAGMFVADGWRLGVARAGGEFKFLLTSTATIGTFVNYQLAEPIANPGPVTLSRFSTSKILLRANVTTPKTALSRTTRTMAERVRGRTVIVDERFGSSPAAWTLGTWTVGTGGLIAPATGGWNTRALITTHTQAHAKTARATITLASTSAVVAISQGGSNSGGTALSRGMAAAFDAAAGNIVIYRWQSSTAAGTVEATAPLGFTPVAGRRYQMRAVWRYFRVEFTITDLVDGSTVTIARDYSNGGGASGTSGIGAWGDGSVGLTLISGSGGAGDVVCERFELTEDVASNPHAIFFGDSNLHGTYLMNDAPQTYARMIDEARGRGDILVSPRFSDKSQDIVNRLPNDLTPFSPKYVVIAIGTNDTSQATWRTNMATIIAAVVERGAVPILCTLPPYTEQQDLMTLMNADILGRYFEAYPILDLAAALSVGGDRVTLDTAKYVGDALHFNAAGHAAIFACAKAGPLMDGALA